MDTIVTMNLLDLINLFLVGTSVYGLVHILQGVLHSKFKYLTLTDRSYYLLRGGITALAAAQIASLIQPTSWLDLVVSASITVITHVSLYKINTIETNTSFHELKDGLHKTRVKK